MRVAAVVVNWNRADLTRECVESIRGGRLVPTWTVVVDNGSVEDPRHVFADTAGSVCWVFLRENRGFAGGANAGMEFALRHGAEAIFLVNNDAVVDPTCLSELVKALERDGSLAAVGAKTLTQEKPPRIHTAYGVLTYHGPLVQQRGWMEPDVTKFNEFAFVDYVSGCAMLLRREALEEVGLFDPEFFAYHEDLEWCVRARAKGYQVAYVPTAVVRHRMHASTNGGGYLSPITYLSARNAILFVRKHASLRLQTKYAVHLAVNLMKDLLLRWRRKELAGFRLRLQGVRDGLLHRPVPLERLGLASRATWHGMQQEQREDG
ncbi:N-acetylglucosaminyl-diphospho-decaprenol L-rhamnosyltransferase [bacterium HR30]|nr:N-acetylglucosaminyl-diphospho-decaprenol L-rhamnosyltransferase [bacterium HR30]